MKNKRSPRSTTLLPCIGISFMPWVITPKLMDAPCLPRKLMDRIVRHLLHRSLLLWRHAHFRGCCIDWDMLSFSLLAFAVKQISDERKTDHANGYSNTCCDRCSPRIIRGIRRGRGGRCCGGGGPSGGSRGGYEGRGRSRLSGSGSCAGSWRCGACSSLRGCFPDVSPQGKRDLRGIDRNSHAPVVVASPA